MDIFYLVIMTACERKKASNQWLRLAAVVPAVSRQPVHRLRSCPEAPDMAETWHLLALFRRVWCLWERLGRLPSQIHPLPHLLRGVRPVLDALNACSWNDCRH